MHTFLPLALTLTLFACAGDPPVAPDQVNGATSGLEPVTPPTPNATPGRNSSSTDSTSSAVALTITLDPHDGMNAVAINADGSLKCDPKDPELVNLHQFRGWVTTPGTEYGRELIVAAPVDPGKEQNGQLNKCVDSDGNVIFADHVRWTTSTSFVAPAAPPTDSPWFDKTKWGSEAKGKPTELTTLADDFKVMCFDEAGARCRPAKYEPVKKPEAGKKIVINVPEGTQISVTDAAPPAGS